MSGLAKIILLAIQLLLCAASIGLGQEESALVRSDMIKYETQLNVILRTRLDEEKAFVHEVVQRIRVGQLPRKIVDKAVLWARTNSEDDDRLFVYFERVLRKQADFLRIRLPVFNYDVYDTSNR